MTTELTVLAWGCVLGLVHIFAAGHFKTRQYGVAWNMGPRDEELPPPSPITGRLMRAQANYFETFPLVAAAILLLAATAGGTEWTRIGALLWLACRIAYLPVYAAGIKGVRSAIFIASLVGLLMLLWPSLF